MFCPKKQLWSHLCWHVNVEIQPSLKAKLLLVYFSAPRYKKKAIIKLFSTGCRRVSSRGFRDQSRWGENWLDLELRDDVLTTCKAINTLVSGPHWSAVVSFDRGYPSFGNFDSNIPIDVFGMKCYMDSHFDSSCVPVRITINKLNLAPNRNMPRFLRVLRKCRGLSTSKLYVSSGHVLLYTLSMRGRLCSNICGYWSSWCKIGDEIYSFVSRRSHFIVDCEVLTAILLVFIKRWGRLFTCRYL